MSHIISNSTVNINDDGVLPVIGVICLCFMCFSFICVCISSFIWSITLLIRIVKDRKLLRKFEEDCNYSTQDHAWIRNTKRQIIKNAFLYAISTIEWITMYILLMAMLIKNWRHVFTPNEVGRPSLDISNTFNSLLNNSLLTKFLLNFLIAIILIQIALIRILTEYLSQQYSFYSDVDFSNLVQSLNE